MVTWRR